MCCFDETLKAIVWSLIAHLKNPLSKTSKTCWGIAEKFKINSFVIFSYRLLHMNIPVMADQQKFSHQICAETGCHLQDFSRVMTNRDRWWEKIQTNPCCQYAFIIMMMMKLQRREFDHQKIKKRFKERKKKLIKKS